MKSIMYHYVQKYNPKERYAKYLDYKNFEKQIIYFKNKYNFFDCSNVDNFFEKKNFKQKIFLTFDDALKSHYNFVYKILKKHNLNGIFYVPTLPYITHKILDVHKIHLILNTFGEKRAYTELKRNLEIKMVDENKKIFFQNKIYKNQKNSFKSNFFKKILNYYVKDKYKSYITKKLFKKFFPELNEKKYCNEFYLNEKEIKIMSKKGMVFGGHTVSHRVLSKLSKKEIFNEVKSSLEFVDNYSSYRTFAYPYGGFHSFNQYSENVLNKFKVKFSMNVENKDITYKSLITRPQALSRFDCNKFPYGQVQ